MIFDSQPVEDNLIYGLKETNKKTKKKQDNIKNTA